MKNVILLVSILVFLFSCSEESANQEVPQVESNEEQVEPDEEDTEGVELSNFTLKIMSARASSILKK